MDIAVQIATAIVIAGFGLFLCVGILTAFSVAARYLRLYAQRKLTNRLEE